MATSASMRIDVVQRHARAAPCSAGTTPCGSTAVSRFMRAGGRAARRRSARRREALEIPEVDEHPAAGRRACRERQGEAALDVIESPGARNRPAAASASIAPLPGRVGTSEIDGRAAGEGHVDRAQQPLVLLAGGNERRRDQQEHAQRDAAARQRSRPRAELGRASFACSAARARRDARSPAPSPLRARPRRPALRRRRDRARRAADPRARRRARDAIRR